VKLKYEYAGYRQNKGEGETFLQKSLAVSAFMRIFANQKNLALALTEFNT